MEILIALAVVCVAGWWLFFRNKEEAVTPAPYKVETQPAPTPVVEAKVEEPAPVVIPVAGLMLPVEGTVGVTVANEAKVEETLVVVKAPVVEAPVKKPRKPRAPKVVETKPVVKAATKKAAPKKAAAIKVAPKASAKSKKV
jgi:hypothetical protein